MSTDTRHPQYDDAILQAAIDEAITQTAKDHQEACPAFCAVPGGSYSHSWRIESPARLALARGLLARLPEPQPPTADGKTPGQVALDSFGYPGQWVQSHKKEAWEECASAVLAAFGGTGLEQAIARIEAVPWKELDMEWDNALGGYENAINAVRARLIAAAREGQPASQPAEIPWTPHEGGPCPLKDEEVEEWELKYRLGSTAAFKFPPTMAFGWNHHNHQDDIIAYRVTKWREGFGPTAVDWKAKYEDAAKERDELLLSEYLYKRVTDALGIEKDILGHVKKIEARAEKAEAELAMSEAAFSNYRGLILSTLNEVGAPTHHPDVGASARKPMTPQERIKALCGLSTLLPEAKAPAVEAAKPAYVGHMTDEMPTKPEPSPQPSPPPWQPAVGDVVRLKSGGPAMTASELRPDGWACEWFDFNDCRDAGIFPAACLMPAKEAQP